MHRSTDAANGSFDSFASTVGEQVRRALVAYYGVEIGSEAAAEAIAVAWERWPEVHRMENAAGFLFRVGQSRARPHIRWASRTGSFPTVERAVTGGDPAVVDLLAAMARLRPVQRASVLLVKSYGFSYRDVSVLLGITETAVTNHVHRGLKRLRSLLEVQ